MKRPIFSNMKFIINVLGILIIGILVGCQKDLMQTENTDNQSAVSLKSAKTNNFMVISKSEALPDGLEKKLADYGEIVNSMSEIGVVVVKPTISNFAKEVGKLTEVRSVVPDYNAKWLEPGNIQPMANPPSIGDYEPRFYLQWALDAIDAPEAWNTGIIGEGARVFILDSGIDADNPDLAPNLNSSLCASFVPGEEWDIQPGEYFNHGTFVAGIVAAADGGGDIIGVAPKAEIVAVKVLSEFTGSGDFSWINEGIVYAANNGANVINMSLGATVSKNGFYIDENDELQKVPAIYVQELILAQQRAVDYAYKKGVVIVCSAGNGASNYDGNGALIKLPAELNNVIAVSATAPDYWAMDYLAGVDPFLDIPSSYTDYGRSLVDIAAPGGDSDFYPQPYWQYDMILGIGSDNTYWLSDGTSFASPHVAGVAALIISKNGGDITNHSVEKQLLKTADKIDTNGKSLFLGNGRVNAYRAVTE